MSSHRWQKLEEIFQTALDLSETDRSEFIGRVCDTDPDLRRKLRRLPSTTKPVIYLNSRFATRSVLRISPH